MEIINTELKTIKDVVFKHTNKIISDENAFEYLTSYLYCYNGEELEKNIYDISFEITNGANDGGIDFVHFDDENSKVMVSQCKYSKNITATDIITELNKMSSTIENFKINNTGSYNDKLKKELQNSLDQLSDENEGNVEYWFFVSSNVDTNYVYNKIDNEHNVYSKDMVNIVTYDDIISKIKEYAEKINTVTEYKLKLDKTNNYLEYSTNDVEGIIVNISSNSLISMYNKYKDDGLFDMNIRKYVKNKIVDDGIKRTLDKERENFWFLNNGLIIACNDYDVDGDKLSLWDFSIVNGGQTTNRIGNYKGSNTQEFYIPCKIICNSNGNQNDFFGKIAEATNSQKPIFPRDLKANSPEMKTLQNWLKKENVYLEIKRGQKFNKKGFRKIKNDELAQLLLAFVYQQPGTARSGKKSVFDNNSIYNKIFKHNYQKDKNEKDFILDLIKFYEDYLEVSDELKNNNEITAEQKNVLKNSKFVNIALFGLLYNITNDDLKISDIKNTPDILKQIDFRYSKFISNYKNDDYKTMLKEALKLFVQVLETVYNAEANNNNVTSISNLFKTDKKYRETIVTSFIQSTDNFHYKPIVDRVSTILKR